MISFITRLVGPDFGAVGSSSQLRAIVGALLACGQVTTVLLIAIRKA